MSSTAYGRMRRTQFALQLHREDSRGKGRTWLVTNDNALIGRVTPADVVVAEESVSRKHARLWRTDDGYLIEDLDSKNATFVNGEILREPVLLSSGDLMTLGEVVLRVELTPVETSVDESAAEDAADASTTVDYSARTGWWELPTAVAPPELHKEEPAMSPRGTSLHIDPLSREAALQSDHLEGLARTTGVISKQLTALLEMSAVLRERFEQVGGRQLLLDLVAQCNHTEANPSDVRELVAFAALAPQIRSVLTIQAALADLLWTASTGQDFAHDETRLDAAGQH